MSGHTEESSTDDELALLGAQRTMRSASPAHRPHLRINVSRVSGSRTSSAGETEFWWDPSDES